MTEKEAKDKAQECNASRVSVFCPMIKDMCRTDCECYVKAWTDYHINNDNGEQIWRANIGYCNAHILQGPM